MWFFFEEKRFPSLVSLCIRLITKHIDDIDALGEIGLVNMDAISKALSRNRGLTPENAKLFYDATNTTLTFYDATRLTSDALTTLFLLNPSLTALHLDFCGHLDDTAMATLCTSLPVLKSLTLYGPFLVRAPAWQQFFKSHPGLEAFRITQSPRFDLACMQDLVRTSKTSLKALKLCEVGQLDESFLSAIAEFGNEDGMLEELDLSSPGDRHCCENSLIALLAAVGPGLKILNLSYHELISDRFLSEGLAVHCSRTLASLNLSHIPLITTLGIVSLFSEWSNPPLVSLSLSRNPLLGGDALEAIMRHSGRHLEDLDVNGWGEIEKCALSTVARWGVELKRLDVGWCREVDDFVVKEWLEGMDLEAERQEPIGAVRVLGCRRLKEVKVWGCNKVTARCPRKLGVSIHGIESHTVN